MFHFKMLLLLLLLLLLQHVKCVCVCVVTLGKALVSFMYINMKTISIDTLRL